MKLEEQNLDLLHGAELRNLMNCDIMGFFNGYSKTV